MSAFWKALFLVLSLSFSLGCPFSPPRVSLSRRLILGGGVAVGFAGGALELYSRFPRLGVGAVDSLPFPKVPPRSVTIVFHGAGGQDDYTAELMRRLGDSCAENEFVHIYDWSKYSSNFIKASFNAQEIGGNLAGRIWDEYCGEPPAFVHAIGVSVGAFAADSLCRQLKRLAGKKMEVQLTLLDPFTMRGIFGGGYGNRHFGKGADYFQQFLNLDDPVPSTNTPLRNSVCYDVTNYSDRDMKVDGHSWPLVYYARHWKNVGRIEESERGVKGTVKKIV